MLEPDDAESCSTARHFELRVRDEVRLEVPPLTATSFLFMIVDDAPDRAKNLKELIEFMDVPEVEVAAPEKWRAEIGDRRLAAVFLSDDLEQDRLRRLISDVGQHDPNIPIVLVKHSDSDV